MASDAKELAGGVVADNKDIWTSPLHLRLSDAQWLVPFAGIGTGLIMSDRTASHELTRGSHRQLVP